jgi:SAM-dependent methyltransferase
MAHIAAGYFDALYKESADPWALSSRWYETRKRAVIMACLPAKHFRRVFEPGCAGGELTLQLAPRANELLATDLHERAVEQARARLIAYPHVTVQEGKLPHNWPRGSFDLIVLSELGYYFEAKEWASVIQHAVDSLSDDGVIVACHWRHDFDVRCQSTVAVHAAIHMRPELLLQVDHVESDFLLQVWSGQRNSTPRVGDSE